MRCARNKARPYVRFRLLLLCRHRHCLPCIDRTNRIPSSVASSVTTSYVAKGWVFVNLSARGDLENILVGFVSSYLVVSWLPSWFPSCERTWHCRSDFTQSLLLVIL